MGNGCIKVLLVEDNLGDARLLRASLEQVISSRFEITHARRLDEALGCLSKDPADVVLLDLSLPDSHGLDTFVRAHSLAPRVPIIVLSGTADETVALKAVRAGAQDYLVKGLTDASLLVRAMRYAIERIQAEQSLQRRNQELELLHEVSSAAALGVHLKETLQAAAEALTSKMRGAWVAIMLLDPENDSLRVGAAAGFPSGAVNSLSLPIGAGITGWVAQRGEPALVPDVRLDPRYHEGYAVTRSELCVPLATGPMITGVLNVESPHPNAFTPSDQRLLSTLAGNLAMLVERARLFDQVEAAKLELQQRADALEEANSRLQELDRLKSRFLATMSHELRTPLSSIIGFSEVLIDGLVGELSTSQKDCVESILLGGEHLLALINDILDLSKIEAGHMTLDVSTFDVRDLIAEIDTAVQAFLDKRSQTLKLEISKDLPSLTADRFRVKQVLLNLLSNAHKFTPTGEHITLSCRLVDPVTLLFSVTDRGIGIKPEDQDLIFEEFRQVAGDGPSKVKGTGLGLAISKRLVELHEGSIWVESEYRRSATFSFLLPIAGPAAQASDSVSDGEFATSSQAVLVVEDDRSFNNLLALYLRREGYTPVQHYGGAGVVERARELRPRLITLDVMLPGRDGWNVLRDLKSDPETKDIPVLVISWLSSSELALSLGAVDYLLKPVHRDDLHTVLSRLPAHGRTAQEARVLVVDDDPEVVPMLREMLPSDGYTFLAAYDGEQGVSQARIERPDAILLDLAMPGMNGFEVLQKLRDDAQTADIPITLLTAKHPTEEDDRRLSEGVIGLSRKNGLSPQSLLAEMRHMGMQQN